MNVQRQHIEVHVCSFLRVRPERAFASIAWSQELLRGELFGSILQETEACRLLLSLWKAENLSW